MISRTLEASLQSINFEWQRTGNKLEITMFYTLQYYLIQRSKAKVM